MLLEKNPNDFMSENPTGWDTQGNLKTDAVLAKYGYKLVRQTIPEGSQLLKKDVRYIARTSWYNHLGYPTHFYLVNPDNTVSDPASKSPLKTVDKYAGRINEIRFLEKMGGVLPSPNTSTSPLSLEQRVRKIEEYLKMV